MAHKSESDPRSGLASVSSILESADIKALIEHFTRPVVMDGIHGVLNDVRKCLKKGDAAPGLHELVDRICLRVLTSESETLRRVVNGTGVILHTGLGRAALPVKAAMNLGTMHGCCNMQIDLETGARGKRSYTTEYLLRKLTEAEAALVVNNNAAATLLILAALCNGKEVIVSRGQLIEIGGSFRLPDCITQSGARMVEVGTTNKTHLRDYEDAITENTGALLHVNPSNYLIVGFTKTVRTGDLAGLKKKHPDLLVIDDLGCGALVDLVQYGLPHEPMVQESVAAGADLVCFSGDKLIGGPQAGIIVGKKALVDRIRKHPLTRMLRICKLTDMALQETLRLFLEPEKLLENHPTLHMLAKHPDDIKRKAIALRTRVRKKAKVLEADVKPGVSAVGGGTLPGVALDTWLLSVRHPDVGPDDLCALLRRHEPPVIARIEDDAVVIDIRTLLPREDEVVVQALLRMEAL